MSKTFSLEDKKRILHEAFTKSMLTGAPHGAVALRLLDDVRHTNALGNPDDDLRNLSTMASGGTHTLASMQYLNATLAVMPAGSPERRFAFGQMLKTGSPFAGLSVYNDWKND